MKHNHWFKRCMCMLVGLIMLMSALPLGILIDGLTALVHAAEPTEFHKMEDLAEVRIGAHYMIVYADSDTRYALGAGAPDENGDSDAVSVTVTPNDKSIITASPDENYVLTMTSRRIDGSYAYAQFTAGNGQRLKLGTSSGKYTPVFNTSGGQASLYESSDGLWRINNSGRYLQYSSENGFYVNKNTGTQFEIWTDAVPGEDLGETRYIEYQPLNVSPASTSRGTELVIVYTAPDGQSYALIAPEDKNDSNAVPVTISGNVFGTNDAFTTALVTNRANAWTVNDDWALQDDRSSAEKSVYRTKLVQNSQYLWMSGDAMFTTDNSKQAYLDLEWAADDDDVTTATILIHGTDADRYLGWDAETQQFIGKCTRENAISVKIYGPSVEQSYNTYYRLTDLSKLDSATKFVITVQNDAYLISATSTYGDWLVPFEKFDMNNDGTITVSWTQRNVEFEHGGITVANSKETQFESPYIRAGGQCWYPQDLLVFDKQNDGTERQRAPFDYNNKKVRFEYGEPNEDGVREIYLRGNASASWLGYDSETGLFTAVSSIGEATPVRIYALSDEEPIYIHYYYYDENGDLYEEPIVSQQYITLAQMKDVFLATGEEGFKDEEGRTLYTFIGWSTSDEYSYLTTLQSANLYDHVFGTKDVQKFTEDATKTYKLVGTGNPDKPDNIDLTEYLSESVKDENGKINLSLYPVYGVRGFDSVVTGNVADASGKVRQVIGISDWKELQGETGYKDLTREKWLGTVYVEIYKDGEIWVESTPMFFSYHNDNTADINLKFIWDELVDEYSQVEFFGEDAEEFSLLSRDPLYQYMSDYKTPGKTTFPEYDQVGHFILDGVYAQQGGGELNLYYDYNWMSDHGGQLDNVVGGSTIKVYVSTKYNVKYYLDDELIEDEDWIDGGYYTTEGTDKKFAEDTKSDDPTKTIYTVDPDNNSGMLLRENNGGTFFEENSTNRGDRNMFFAYRYYYYEHEFDVKKTPEELVKEGYTLVSENWSLKDSSKEELETVEWVDGTVYVIDGNTGNAYKEGDASPFEADSPYTFHLYAGSATGSGNVEIPETGDNGSVMLWPMLLTVAMGGIVLALILQKKRVQER